MDYDLIVIGGGPAGYTGALHAAKNGMKVLLFEKDLLGGTCLNRGCIPAKTLLKSAGVFELRQSLADFGISADNFKLDEEAVYARKDKIVNSLRESIASLLSSNRIEVIYTEARLTDNNTVSGGGGKYTAKYILVATGSIPALPAIPGIENAVTSDRFLERPLTGNKIIVIGGGVIGAEAAEYLNAAGREVVIIEAADRILSSFSRDISLQLSGIFKKKNIKIITSAKVTNISKNSVTVSTAKGEESIECDVILCAAGRKITGKDDDMKNCENIFIAGDAAGGVMLAHYAAAQATVAVDKMLGREPSVDLSTVPACVYTSPEIASVGKAEAGEDCKAVKYPLGANARAMVENSGRGFIRIVSDGEGTVKGAEIFGPSASELIAELAFAVSHKMKLKDIARVIHAHPTLYESIADAAK